MSEKNVKRGEERRQLASRKRSVATLADRELQKVRVITWFLDLVQRAVPDVMQRNSVAGSMPRLVAGYPEDKFASYGWALNSWIERLKLESINGSAQARVAVDQLSEAENVALVNIDKAHYELGQTSPSDRTLDVFEKLLKNSKSVYTDGPDGMPLWALLDGDLSACSEFIDDVTHTESLPSGINDTVLQWLFDELLDPPYRVDVNHIPQLFQATTGAHPISSSYIERLMGYPLSDRDDVEEHLFWRRYDQAVLMAIAIWRSVFNKETTRYRREMEWLMVGLCHGVLGIRLNEAIQAYVFSRVREYGQQMDTMLAGLGGSGLSFEERWRQLCS